MKELGIGPTSLFPVLCLLDCGLSLKRRGLTDTGPGPVSKQGQLGQPQVVFQVVDRSSTAPYFHLVTESYRSHLLLFSRSFLVAMQECFSDSRC